MYLALFLAPWMLMYALSTMAMNHRDYFKKLYGESAVLYEKEEEQAYDATFGPHVDARMMAVQILGDLDMDGTHSVNTSSNDGQVRIFRHDPISPKRITYVPADEKLIIERQVFRAPAFLERMHRRQGYRQPYALEDAWAFSVDLAIVAMLFWVASGLWMWWELRVTRRWGALFAAAGLGLFGFFLSTI
jgi:hypothetical protein